MDSEVRTERTSNLAKSSLSAERVCLLTRMVDCDEVCSESERMLEKVTIQAGDE
jgi:hypothetical protein